MKHQDLPQDAGKLGKYRELTYVVSEDGSYMTAQSAGWDVKNAANDLAWEEIGRRIEGVRQDVMAGRKSPLAYHMVRCQMDEGMLAAYTGFRRRDVRRHLTVEGFRDLTLEELRCYASALSMDVRELCITK